MIDAVNYATSVINQNRLDKNKCVINMSLGGGISSGLDQAVRNAANQNKVRYRPEIQAVTLISGPMPRQVITTMSTPFRLSTIITGWPVGLG